MIHVPRSPLAGYISPDVLRGRKACPSFGLSLVHRARSLGKHSSGSPPNPVEEQLG